MTNERVIPSNQAKSVATYTLLSDGNELPRTYHLLSLTVHQEINRIPWASLILLDGEPSKETFVISNEADFEPGKEIEIKLGYRSDEETLFRGLVVKHSIKVRKGGAVLVIECKDRAERMAGACRSRYFHDVTDGAVIEELIDAHGLDKEVDPTSLTHTQVVQYNATDWDMALCRAEVNGLLVTVKDGKVTAAKPAFTQEPALTIQYGATVYELDAEIDARLQFKTVKGTTWDPAEQALSDGIEAEEPNVPDAGNLDSDTLASVLDDEDFRLFHGGRLSDAELQSLVDAAMLKHRLAKIRGRVTTDGTAEVEPGKLLQLQGVGDRFEGKLFITGVRHSLESGTWKTTIQFGLDPRWFVDTFDVQAPLAAALLPPIRGLHIGKVVGLEGDPDGEDRIQVRIPIIHADDEGAWCRLATLDAGAQRGTWFRPEIGDEVVVGFLDNDPRHAVVLGQLHSSSHPAPESPSDTNDIKGYQSREGMKLTFDDSNKVIQLETPKGNKITLSETDTKVEILDQNQNKLVMDADGILIESGKDLRLKAVADLKIEGMNVDCQGTAGVSLGGSAGTELSLNGTTNLKGPMVNIN